MSGTPWRLGVRCDRLGCESSFEGDFLVHEDATRGERLRVVLDHVRDKEGWRVAWPPGAPADGALTFCPAHADDADGRGEPDWERVRRCGPLSDCARNGHADRLPGEPLADHVWPAQ